MAITRSQGVSLLALLSMVATACAAGPSVGRPEDALSGKTSQADSRTLVIAMRSEPAVLVSEELNPTHTGNSPDAPWQIFHGELTQYDEKATPQLQLAEAFPQLGADSWQVFPDGRMETTWRLRPNLTWHDGAPLVADDFVLSIQFMRLVGKSGIAKGIDQVDGASAPDPHTLVIRYRNPLPQAGDVAWEPMPRHILGRSFEQMEGRDPLDAFVWPYWTNEFVGVGPYRLERWEPGAFITGLAFPDYVHGKPKIGRVQLTWIGDANAAAANLLSGAVHFATDQSLAFEQVSVLKREWAARGEPGSILLATARTVYVQLQFQPEYVKPTAMLDLRFRQALAHAIDKQAIVDAVLDGEPGMADTLVGKDDEYYPELDRLLTKYPLDPRRTDQLLAEMGFTKDRDGFYSQSGTRLSASLTPLGNYQREALVLADGWKRAGIETPIRTLSAAEQLSKEFSQTFPAMAIIQYGIKPDKAPFPYFASGGGPNAGGYSDPEFNRLADVYTASLDRKDRNRAIVQGMRLVSDQAAYFPLYYASEVVAYGASLVGPLAGRQKYAMWKMEEWSWQ